MISVDFRRVFVENWPIKVASLLLALTLWFYVTSKGKTEVSLTPQLQLRNVPQGMAVVGDVPGTVEVRLQGQERVLRDIASSRTVVGMLDLSSAHEGENRIHLSPDDIRRPAGASVTYLSPSEITVRLERLVRRTLRLRPVVQGRPAAGYRYLGASVRPQRITLEGPESVIDTFTSIETMPIDIAGLNETTTVEPRINYRGRTVKVLEQNIRVTITVRRERP